MFTGIIKSFGTVLEIKKKEAGSEIILEIAESNVSLGSSVSVGGICLTVTQKEDSIVHFDVMPETLKKTTLGDRASGDKVNIETTLRVGDEVGGHFVYGHVDGVGEVVNIVNQGDNRLIEFKASENILKYIAPQGSVAVDGVSLTVASFMGSTFTVSLIPFTLRNTTLGMLKVGDKVNVESDMLAKYSVKNKSL